MLSRLFSTELKNKILQFKKSHQNCQDAISTLARNIEKIDDSINLMNTI
jgi:prefoldin subunit 5